MYYASIKSMLNNLQPTESDGKRVIEHVEN